MFEDFGELKGMQAYATHASKAFGENNERLYVNDLPEDMEDSDEIGEIKTINKSKVKLNLYAVQSIQQSQLKL